MIWGLSLHGWEDIMRGSLAIVGVVGLIVGLSTWYVVKLQRVEIAESNQKLEELRAANLKLEEQIQPRRLSQDQQNGIIRALHGLSEFKNVAIISYVDVESARLVGQLVDTLYASPARMSVSKYFAQLGLGGAFLGISIRGKNKSLADAMLKAFKEIGHLKVSSDAVHWGFIPDKHGLAEIEAEADVVIFVGAKPIE